ncbi:MAG: hypothetical protein OHK0040_04500 [bacterium]
MLSLRMKRIKIIITVLIVSLLFFSCGKKGPLKPQQDPTLLEETKKATKISVPQPKNLTYQISENKGSILLSYEGDCKNFKIYRYVKGKNKPQFPYAVTEKGSFLDEMPLLNRAMIYEVSCVVNDVESENNPVVEVILR